MDVLTQTSRTDNFGSFLHSASPIAPPCPGACDTSSFDTNRDALDPRAINKGSPRVLTEGKVYAFEHSKCHALLRILRCVAMIEHPVACAYDTIEVTPFSGIYEVQSASNARLDVLSVV